MTNILYRCHAKFTCKIVFLLLWRCNLFFVWRWFVLCWFVVTNWKANLTIPWRIYSPTDSLFSQSEEYWEGARVDVDRRSQALLLARSCPSLSHLHTSNPDQPVLEPQAISWGGIVEAGRWGAEELVVYWDSSLLQVILKLTCIIGYKDITTKGRICVKAMTVQCSAAS